MKVTGHRSRTRPQAPSSIRAVRRSRSSGAVAMSSSPDAVRRTLEASSVCSMRWNSSGSPEPMATRECSRVLMLVASSSAPRNLTRQARRTGIRPDGEGGQPSPSTALWGSSGSTARTSVPAPGGLVTASVPSHAPDPVGEAAQAGALGGAARRRRRRRGPRRPASRSRTSSRTVACAGLGVLGDVRERLGDGEVRGHLGRAGQPIVGHRKHLDRYRGACGERLDRPRRARARSARPDGSRAPARAARRRPARAPGPRRSRNGPADSGSRSNRLRASRTSSPSVTRRCCAPSWRSRSIRRRAASAASTIRMREARSSSVRARSISRSRSASSAARRSVTSNSAPSIQRRPPGPSTSCPRSSTQRVPPSARMMRYSTANVGCSSVTSATARMHPLAVARVDDARQRPLRAGDEVRRRIARDPLDLVADQLQPVSGVPGGAVDRAGDVDHQRAHQRVVRALLRRPEAGAGAREQLAAGERAVQVVVGARVQRRVGALAPRRRP